MRSVTISILFLLAFSANANSQDKYAVLVGVEVYDPEMFENLEFSDEDAVRLAEALDELDFGTTTLTRNSESARMKPSNAENIVSAIANRAKTCGLKDTLIVSLSRHGVQFSDEEPLDSGIRETYFCPENASLDDKSTLLPISKLVELMDSCEAHRKLLIIDACRNDALSMSGRRRSSARKILLGSVHESRKSVPSGMAVLFSCESGQFSWEHDKLKQSVFSNFLAEYLEGKADSKYYEDESLSLDGLIYFVRKRTNDYVFKKLSANGQLPILHNQGADWALAKNSSSQSTKEESNGLNEWINSAVGKWETSSESKGDLVEGKFLLSKLEQGIGFELVDLETQAQEAAMSFTFEPAEESSNVGTCRAKFGNQPVTSLYRISESTLNLTANANQQELKLEFLLDDDNFQWQIGDSLPNRFNKIEQ